VCGIAGYSVFSSECLASSSLKNVASLLAHRGPDDSGFFQDQGAGIGIVHTRLSIQDPSPSGHQPMLSPDGRVVIAFNGEIYNFRELRAGLESNGSYFIGNSDTEVLLHLYLAWRESDDNLDAFWARINGIFAVVIWDADLDRLLLVRDAQGVKPLYYVSDLNLFAFASEIKALMPLVGGLHPLDAASIDSYISHLWCAGAGTPSSRVKKLLPGQLVMIRRGSVIEQSIWSRSYTCNISHCFESGAISIAEERLRQAVHRQMVADVPVGAFLSGGLDSSSIVALAREINPDIQCFTIDVRQSGADGFADDLPYARHVARHLRVPLQVVQVEAAQMAAELEAMVWQLDEPLADPAPLNVLHICHLAREQGIKVLLSGAGGDDLFTGYRRHLALDNEKWWRWLPRPLRLQLRALTGQLPTSHPLTRRLRKVFSGADLEGDAGLVHYFRWIERADLQALYSPEFRATLAKAPAEDPMLEFLAGLPANTPALERMLALEQRFFLPDHNLTYTDKMSMAVGVEVRVPFLDLDLVEFAAQIPLRFKQRGRQGKWILKKAMEPYLPKEVIYRPKSGFGAPLRRWLQVELRDWLADTLSVDRLQRRGLFEPQAVQRLIAANADGRIDASYTLLSLACIEIWCKYFIDGAPSPQLELTGR
jgi:asparagine synthase (glutamine-hydrolysing)